MRQSLRSVAADRMDAMSSRACRLGGSLITLWHCVWTLCRGGEVGALAWLATGARSPHVRRGRRCVWQRRRDSALAKEEA